MEIRLLGPLEVIAGGAVVPLGGRRERALLAVLSLSPRQVLSADRLIDELWGEQPPANPTNALQALVSRLRRSLGRPATVVTQPPGYLLDLPPEAVDAARFRSMVAEAGTIEDPAVRSRSYRSALELWRGDALADFALEEFAQRDAAALEELRLMATEERISADLEAGGGAGLVPELEALVATHPLRESLRASQMLALYRAGRQADALRAFSDARRVLGEELGIEPGPELRALEESILLQQPQLQQPQLQQPERGSPGSAPPAAPALPARVASFIGRADEMSRVAAAFEKSRLVTLTGPGGAGKTSLAIEVARELAPHYDDGAWLIELAPLVEGARVADTLVEALQLELGGTLGRVGEVPPLRAVIEYLRRRRALLVIDNCEHVIDAAASSIEGVLLACADVDVLATSRDRLGIGGEVLWRVPPLGVGDGDEPADAVRLFVERAEAVNPAFDPSEAGLARIADICRRLDGMPLAIELAAARTRSLPVSQIADRLSTGIGVLSAGSRGTDRQRTLQATIDWSHELLAQEDQALFARLSVLHGSFTLAAAEAAAPRGWTAARVLEAVERLIDSSMLSLTDTAANPRYRMLETLRLYGAVRLTESGARDEVMQQVLAHFLEALAEAEDALRGPDQLAWLDRIEADLDTIRSVLDWSATHAPGPGVRLAGMLGWFWYLRGNSPEARHRLGVLLEAAGPDVDPWAVAHARFFLSLHEPHPERALAGFAAARDAYADTGDRRGVAQAMAMLAAWGSDRTATREQLERAESLCVTADHPWGVALVRFLQAGSAAVRDEIALSGRLAEDAARRFAALGDRWGEGYSLYALGVAKRSLGDYPGAEKAFRAAVESARPMRLRREMAPVMSELASIAMMQGHFDRAAQLLDEARVFADEVPFAGSQGMVRNAQGRLARMQGDYATARQLHHEAISLFADGDSAGGLAYSHSCLGFAEELSGNLETAAEHHRLALQYAQTSDDVFAVALALEGVGATLVAGGQIERGVALIGAGLEARERVGVPLPPGERLETTRALEVAQASAGPQTVADALEAGRRLDLDAAIAAATETP